MVHRIVCLLFLMAGTSLLTESCALSTYNDQSVSFVLENGCYVINVEDCGKNQEKGRVPSHI